MRKKVAFVIATLMCLALAQVGLTLWASFMWGSASHWTLYLYDPMVPIEAAEWVIHTIAIAFVVALAVKLRHGWEFGTLLSFVVAGVFGAMVIPLFISGVHAAAFGELKEFDPSMTQQAMISHVITAALAAILGIAFGQYLTADGPARPSVLGKIAARALAMVRRLRRQYPRTSQEL